MARPEKGYALMDAGLDEAFVKYWANPNRFVLVRNKTCPDTLDRCHIYDFLNHIVILLEDDRIAAAVKSIMSNAGAKVIPFADFMALKQPIDDYKLESILVKRSREEIDAFLASRPNPFVSYLSRGPN